MTLANYTQSVQESLPDEVIIGVPDGCISSGSTDGSKCHIFLRMGPNEKNHSFVDFYMEGNLTGWVAVGFSMDEKMVTDINVRSWRARYQLAYVYNCRY